MNRPPSTFFAIPFIITALAGPAHAVVINLNAVDNGSVANPVSMVFTPGRYIVTPISVADGGLYNAWQPGGTPGWTSNCYNVYSASIPFQTIGDCTERFPTDLEALSHARSTTFTLVATESVNFSLQDCTGCTLDNIGGLSLKVARTASVTVTGGFTSFSGEVGTGQFVTTINGNVMLPNAGGCGSVTPPFFDIFFCTFNFVPVTPSVDFKNSSFGNPQTPNLISFAPAPAQDVTLGQEFLLGTFTYENGIWFTNPTFGFSLTTVSDDPAFDGHVFSDVLILTITTNHFSCPDPICSPASNADFISFQGRPDLGSVRAYELQDSPTGSNVVTVEFYGTINSLDPTRFANAQGGGFIDPSVGLEPTLPPVASCQNVTVDAIPGLCAVASASVDAGSFDPGGGPITSVQTPPGPYPVGTTPVTLVVTNDLGASASCTAVVTVVDSEPPAITCPDDVIVDAASAAGAVVTFPAATATDNCAQATVAYSQDPGTTFEIGSTTVTATATDPSGTTSICDFTVTVRGPHAIEEDVVAQLQPLLAGVTNKRDARKLGDAIDDLIEANDPAWWEDDSQVEPTQGERVFDKKRDGVHTLRELAQKNSALAPDLALEIAREVLACRILVEVALPEATGKDLAHAQKELAKGDTDAAAGKPDSAIDHYKRAWIKATGN